MRNETTYTDGMVALEANDLLYTVRKVPLSANGVVVPNLSGIEKRWSDGRTQVLPGVAHNDRYKCIQNTEPVDIINRICQEASAEITNCRELMHGRAMCMQAKLPDVIRVKDSNDVIEKFLTFLWDHAGKLCFLGFATQFRLFCENQFKAMLADIRDGIKIRHTASSEDKLKVAHEVILQALNAHRVFEQKLNWLADQRFNRAMVELATRNLFGVKEGTETVDIPTRTQNNMAAFQETLAGAPGQDQFRGSAYWFYNGVTRYADHERGIRKNTDRFEANLVGSSAMLKDKAMKVIDATLASGPQEIVSYAS